MAYSRRFALRLATRVASLLAAAATAVALFALLDAPTAALLALFATVASAFELWRHVNQGNIALARFVTALERSDLGQSFRWDGRGAGFDQLGEAYENALNRLRRERADGASTARSTEALVDSAPTPLLVLEPDECVRFANKAARQMFGQGDTGRLEALAPFGPPFVAALRSAAPGPTRLSHIVLDGLSQRVTLDTTQTEMGGRVQRIVALKVIQLELDEAELAAQIDLVRVLTHEVMNSLTPVTSLAATAARLVGGLDPAAAPGIADAALAVDALARRAAELERFVTSYKGFSDAPALHRTAIDVAGWFAQLDGLFAGTPAARGVATSWSTVAGVADVDGDAALLTQVMLNLLKNAGEACAQAAGPAIEVRAAMALDGRVRIMVSDNGPGVAAALVHEVFLPFFTTKPSGTGIGLSFARQIVMLHGGQIGIAAAPGSCFEMLLPAKR